MADKFEPNGVDMILKYGAKNFFSFKEGIEISFELGANCPHSISKGKKVANLLCVKGANASGKTNALKVISFMRNFCVNSFTNKPEASLFVDSFFNNSDLIDMFCEFQIDSIQYRYEVSILDKEVISEVFSRKIKRWAPVFTREKNELKYWISDYNELKQVKLRSNASIISTAYQYESKCIIPIYNFFRLIQSNVGWSGRFDLIPTDNYSTVSEFYRDNQDSFDFAKNIIKNCDLGIKDIKIEVLKDEKGENIYFPVFEHDAEVNNNKLKFYSQSSGTRALYLILPLYKIVLETGGLLVLDEFDINFHPHMLPVLVGLFDDEKINKNNAQMIFSTHNSEIMDQMSKYRTIIINQEHGESYGYRLDEIPGDLIRNDRPISPVYNAGKIGGVPKI